MLRLNYVMSALPLIMALNGCGAKTGLRDPDLVEDDAFASFDASPQQDVFIMNDSGVDIKPENDASVDSDVLMPVDREEPRCTTSSDGPMCNDLVDTILRNDPVSPLRTMMLDGHRVLDRSETDRVESQLRREYPNFPQVLTPDLLEVRNHSNDLIPWQPRSIVSYRREGAVLFVLVSDTNINGEADVSGTALLLYHVHPQGAGVGDRIDYVDLENEIALARLIDPAGIFYVVRTFQGRSRLTNAVNISNHCSSSVYSTGMSIMNGALMITGLDSIREGSGSLRVDYFANFPRLRREINPNLCIDWNRRDR